MSSTCGCGGSAGSAIDSVLAAKSAKLSLQIGIAVLGTANKAAQLEGAAAVQLLQETARLSEALGKGENFSAIA